MNTGAARAIGRALQSQHVAVEMQTVIDCGADRIIVMADDGPWRLTRVIVTEDGASFYGHRQSATHRDLHVSGPRTFKPVDTWDAGRLAMELEEGARLQRGTIPGSLIETMQQAAEVLR